MFTVTESIDAKSLSKIIGKLRIVAVNEEIAVEDWQASSTDGNVYGHPHGKGIGSGSNKYLLIS